MTCALFSPREVCKIIDISDKITLKWQQTVTRREQTIYPRELSKVSEFSRTLYFKTNWWCIFLTLIPFNYQSAAWKFFCSLLIKRIIKAYRRILLPLDKNCFLHFKRYRFLGIIWKNSILLLFLKKFNRKSIETYFLKLKCL